MMFISDMDKERLIEARSRMGLIVDRNGPLSSQHREASMAHTLISEVLTSIERLGHPAPYQEARIVELSDVEIQRIYPERANGGR